MRPAGQKDITKVLHNFANAPKNIAFGKNEFVESKCQIEVLSLFLSDVCSQGTTL